MTSHDLPLRRPDLDGLLAHAGFLRALARGLVGDEHGAEDLAQETWIAALEHPPVDRRSPRAWLATVARNLARNGRRAEQRRRARERRAAAEELQPTHEEAVDRLELLRVVLERMLALPEPYRGVLYLRYCQGLTAGEIAVRRRVPLETVRTQLARARERLRRDLDGRPGGREGWTAGLIALAEPVRAMAAAAAPLPWIGGIVAVKKTALLAMALLVSGAVWTAWRLEDPRESAPARAGGAPEAPSAPSAHGPAALSAPVAGERSAVAGPGAEATPPRDSAALELSGTVRLRDVRGRELPPLDARMRLQGLREHAPLEALEVDVRAGAWRASVSAGSERSWTHLQVLGLLAEGMRIVVESPRDRVPIPSSGVLHVQALLPDATVLEVTDEATGAPLRGIAVVRYPNRFEAWPSHPGSQHAERVVGAGLTSPIELSALPGVETLRPAVLVGAEGYAWKRVPVDADRGGRHAVALARGGGLSVHVRGVEAGTRPELRLREAGGEPVLAEEIRSDGESRLEGLAPGAYVVSVVIVRWNRDPVELAESGVEVVAGATARVELGLEPAPRLAPASAAGRVLVPRAWGVERLSLTVEPLGGDPHDIAGAELARASDPEEGCDVYPWSFERLRAGRHELLVIEPRFSAVLDLPPGESRGWTVRVPPPVDLRVLVVDASSGRPVRDVPVLWNLTPPEGLPGGLNVPARFDEQARAFVIRAPSAPIDLLMWDLRYETYRGRIDPDRGERELTVRLQRACGLELALLDGGDPVLPPSGWKPALTPREGTQGEMAMTGRVGRALRVQVSAPGVYQVELPEVDGFHAPPPQRVEVLAGAFTRLEVPLERAP